MGTVEPTGWLRRQLAIQAAGSAGHLDEFWADLADNAWRGGDRRGWERGPYYADGLVPLAHLLDDSRLVEKADSWVAAFLDSQTDTGRFRPARVPDRYESGDPWPRFLVCKVLVRHYEATGEDRALSAVLDYARWLRDNPDEWSLATWARMRWADMASTLLDVFEYTDERWLLDVIGTLAERGYDWSDHFGSFEYTRVQPPSVVDTDDWLPTHVVNNAMGLTAPAVASRLTGADRHATTLREAVGTLDRFHGQATGLFSGDEHLAGRNPARGTELCAVVEYAASLERAARATGETRYADRLERIVYNALPATFTADMCAHQYDQQVNQVLCAVEERPWSNGPDATTFGQTPTYGCCQANFGQGWPKFAASLWARGDDGPVALAYGPSRVSTTVAGEQVLLVQDTEYPFADTVTIRVETAPSTAMGISMRVPGWAGDSEVTTPDGSRSPAPGSFVTVEREWEDGDALTLSLIPEITVERRYRGAITVSRGPLVFALPIDHERKRIGGEPPYADWELYPTEEWRYGLDVPIDTPAEGIELQRRDAPGETPFDPGDPPVTLSAPCRRLPDWDLVDGAPAPPPLSPVAVGTARRSRRLVPYGCTNLRLTELPVVEG